MHASAFGGVRRVAVALLIAAVPACRCGASGSDAEHADASASNGPGSSGSDSASASTGPATLTDDADPAAADEGSMEALLDPRDAGHRFRDAEPKADVDLGGPPDPACTGAEIVFASAVVDARCAISSTRAKKLRALLEERDAGALPLRQEAKVTEDGRVALRLVNKGGASLTLPLSFHAKLPAFTALAEDEQHTLYELEAPALELRDPGQGNRSHFARILLPPGGAAVATIAISPNILRVLGRGAGDKCKDGGPAASADGGACNLTKLPKGRYVLHLGELLTDVEAGPPARVTWDLP